MSFTPEEIDYLASQPLARMATVASDGHPDAVPSRSNSTDPRSGSEATSLSCRPGRSATSSAVIGTWPWRSTTWSPSIPSSLEASASTAGHLIRSNGPAGSVLASTFASCPPPPGAGTWMATRLATPGIQHGAPITTLSPARSGAEEEIRSRETSSSQGLTKHAEANDNPCIHQHRATIGHSTASISTTGSSMPGQIMVNQMRDNRKSSHVLRPTACSGERLAPSRKERAALPGILTGRIGRRFPTACR